MKRAITHGLVAAAMLTGCSTMTRISEGDWGMYSGTKASRESGNTVDRGFSVVGDMLLLPITGIAYLFGYRYADNSPTSPQPDMRSARGTQMPSDASGPARNY
jgi:hypothetical protein